MASKLHTIRHALTKDRLASRRWFRGLSMALGAACVASLLYAPEAWKFPLAFAGSLLSGIGGLISIGEPNPPEGS